MSEQDRITYRKTKAGEWVAFGPADLIAPGPVTVHKKDGSTKDETITKVGRPFTVDGREMAYGYLTPSGEPCANCDRPGGARYLRHDSSGIAGKVCEKCRFQPSYVLSFA
jgi:hypothetical protein